MHKQRAKANLLAITFLVLVQAACQQTATPSLDDPQGSEIEDALYRNPGRPTEERVTDLLGRMTLEEKIGQMTLVEKNSIKKDDIADLALGALLSGGGGYPADNSPEGWLSMATDFQEYALQTRLGIPLLYGVDAVHGHNNVIGAVIFPHNIGLGATRDAELVEQIGRATAEAVAATGITWNYAPSIAVPQDIRWGRTYEGYAEDTGLVTELGAAFLRGLQGDDLAAPDTILATPKHYLGDGGTTFGTSTQEVFQPYLLDQGDTRVDEDTLRAIHLPPYKAAIDEGARSIMASFSSWNGDKVHGSEYLLSELLKDELGFTGFIVSDWAAIDQINADYYQAVVTAINAGVDMNMVPYDYPRFVQTLKRAVEEGDVSLERIDEAVRRILTVKFDLGLFERPFADEELLKVVGSSEHRNLAQQAVSQSLVLLKNEDGVLPIAEDTEVILVAGQAADDIGIQSGGWTIEWQGKEGDITEGTTILEAIQSTAPHGAAVYYDSKGLLDSVQVAEGSDLEPDVCIGVAGERPYAEGVGDSSDLALPAEDLEM
ncbi:MAG: glycoside hydrolase family 3 protein, partial [Chloroflexota bacterium]